MADTLIVPWGLHHKLVNEEKIIIDDYKRDDLMPSDYKTKDNGYYFYNTFGTKVQWNADTMNTLVPDKAKDLISKGKFYIALSSFEADIPRYDYIPYEFAIAKVTNLTVDNITITKMHGSTSLWRDINGIINDDQIRAFRTFYDTDIPSGEIVRMFRIFLGYIRYVSPKTYIKGINHYRYL